MYVAKRVGVVYHLLRDHPFICGISMGLASVLMDVPAITGANQRAYHFLAFLAIWLLFGCVFTYVRRFRWTSKHRLGRH